MMKNRKNINSIATILFIVCIIIFFIPSVINSIIPNVKSEEFKSRKIKKTIYINTVLTAKESYSIYIPENSSAEEYYLKYGESVGNGIPILKLKNHTNTVNKDKEKARVEYQIKSNDIQIIKAEKEKILKENDLNKEKIVLLNDDIEVKRTMYSSGLISQKEFNDYDRSYKENIGKIEIETKTNEIKLLQKENELTTLSEELKNIAGKIKIDQSENEYYYYDSEGVCRVVGKGFISYILKDYGFKKDKTKVIEITKFDDYNSLIFNAKVPIENRKYFNIGDIIEIENNDEDKPYITKINYISNIVDENNEFLIELEFDKEPEGRYGVGNIYSAKLEIRFEDENLQAIPLVALTEDTISEGGANGIFVVDERNKNILGNTELEKVDVKIIQLGDEYALCKLPDRAKNDIDKKRLVTNIDYKLQTGKKVHLCY